VAISTAQSTLKISPDYRPLIKIIARSNYEIGNYTEAKKFLIQYNNL
jgi:Tfp pilus assembly protein PilF